MDWKELRVLINHILRQLRNLFLSFFKFLVLLSFAYVYVNVVPTMNSYRFTNLPFLIDIQLEFLSIPYIFYTGVRVLVFKISEHEIRDHFV